MQASSGRFAMDSTGNGAQLAEELSGEYSCMEPVQFATRVETGARDEKNKPITMPVKESMAYALKRRMEDGEVLISRVETDPPRVRSGEAHGGRDGECAAGCGEYEGRARG